MVDLSDIPLVDNHCHGLYAETAGLTVDDYRIRFSESGGVPFPADHTATAPHYLWALRQIAGLLGCEPDEETVVAARGRRSREELDRLFLGSANAGWLLVDDGYPEPEACSSREELAARGGVRVGWVERVETVAARLAAAAGGFAAFADALDAHLGSARERGVCGLKSVAAYRSGLAIEPPVAADAERAFEALRG